MPLSLASVGPLGDKKHWFTSSGRKEPSSLDIPFEKAHVLPGSCQMPWHDRRSTLSFIEDWRKTRKLEILLCLLACLAPSLHYLDGSHFAWLNQNSLSSPYYLFLTCEYLLKKKLDIHMTCSKSEYKTWGVWFGGQLSAFQRGPTSCRSCSSPDDLSMFLHLTSTYWVLTVYQSLGLKKKKRQNLDP